MSETPVGYLPDVRCQWSQRGLKRHKTEIIEYRDGGEARRPQFQVGGYEAWQGKTDVLKPYTRQVVRDFLDARRGAYAPFYFFRPDPAAYDQFSLGTWTAKRRDMVPLTESTLIDVRKDGLIFTGWSVNRMPMRPTVQATINNQPAAFAAAYFGNLLSSYIDCGAGAGLKTVDYSVSVWIYTTQTGIAQGIVGNEVNLASGFSLRLNSANQVVYRPQGVGVQNDLNSGFTVPAKTWTHVMFTKSGTSVVWYINGVAFGSPQVITITPVVATSNFNIGRMSTTLNSFNGLISDVRYYNAALTAGNAATIYSTGQLFLASCAGWWKLEDGTGSASDYSGNGNTGTLQSSAQWCGGEDELDLGSAQTGVIAVTSTSMRKRLVARNAIDDITNDYMSDTADAWPTYDIQVKEVR